MRIGRTIPPAASPIDIRDIFNGLKGLGNGKLETERFQSELQDYFNVKHCYLVSSGKAALTVILEALHELYPDRNEVLIPAFICFSVPSAIMRAGLKVKLCDVDDRTLDFDYAQLEKILKAYGSNKNPPIPNSQKLLAVLPAHLFGLAADVERVGSLTKGLGIYTIEDAAQVLGMTKKEKNLGTLGDVGFLSLGRGKALSAVEGGIIFTNQEDLAERIEKRFLKISNYSIFEVIKLILEAIALSFFQNPLLFWFPKSLPFLKIGDTIYNPDFKIRRMSAFQAGLLKSWKGKLTLFKKERSANSEIMLNFLKKEKKLSSFITSFINSEKQDIPDGRETKNQMKMRHEIAPFIRFPVIISNRKLWNDIIEESDRNGVGITHTYPSSVNNIDELKSCFKNQSYVKAERLPHQLLTFPVHPYVTRNDFKKSHKILKSIVNRQTRFKNRRV